MRAGLLGSALLRSNNAEPGGNSGRQLTGLHLQCSAKGGCAQLRSDAAGGQGEAPPLRRTASVWR